MLSGGSKGNIGIKRVKKKLKLIRNLVISSTSLIHGTCEKGLSKKINRVSKTTVLDVI